MSKLVEDNLTVLGLKFRHKKDARERLATQLRSAPLAVALFREPDNKYDPNAIMVLGAAGEWDGVHLGYLGREVAELLAPSFDAQTLFTVEAELTELSAPDWSSGVVHVVLESTS